jgi:hypothetical protein
MINAASDIIIKGITQKLIENPAKLEDAKGVFRDINFF